MLSYDINRVKFEMFQILALTCKVGIKPSQIKFSLML